MCTLTYMLLLVSIICLNNVNNDINKYYVYIYIYIYIHTYTHIHNTCPARCCDGTGSRFRMRILLMLNKCTLNVWTKMKSCDYTNVSSLLVVYPFTTARCCDGTSVDCVRPILQLLFNHLFFCCWRKKALS